MLKEIDISLLDPSLTLFELNLHVRVNELAKKDWVSDQLSTELQAVIRRSGHTPFRTNG